MALKEYRASNQGDSDDDDRRQTMAPAIAIVSDGKAVTGSERKRRRSRRDSIGLRRDSRSGARAVSPAAFLQYQNNMNLSDMSQFLGNSNGGGSSPSTGKARNTSPKNSAPFLETDLRVGQNKAPTYKRNEEEYKREIENSLNIARAGQHSRLVEETKFSPK
mgnify:CR=1 FL=1